MSASQSANMPADLPDTGLDYGDEVRHRLTGWRGIVVGERDYGTYLTVVFLINNAPMRAELESVLVVPFVADNDNNVIDFTKAVNLRKDTPTGGAA